MKQKTRVSTSEAGLVVKKLSVSFLSLNCLKFEPLKISVFLKACW